VYLAVHDELVCDQIPLSLPQFQFCNALRFPTLDAPLDQFDLADVVSGYARERVDAVVGVFHEKPTNYIGCTVPLDNIEVERKHEHA
jgi:hypothetical protein